MSFVLFKDSFDRYDTGNLSGSLLDNFLSRWTQVGGTPTIISTGRNGQAIQAGNANFSKTLAHSTRWVVGFAFLATAPGNTQNIYQLANNDNILARVIYDTDSTLSIRAGNTTQLGATNRALHLNRWYYIEIDISLSGSSPIMASVELRINGNVEVSGSGSTGVNAANTLSNDSSGNFHQFFGIGGVGNADYFDDLYIKNEAGYEGDPKVVPAYPSADGGTLMWTPSAGSDHFAMVDTHPVDLTKWLETTGTNDIDLWEFVLPNVGGIVAINFSVLARKDDEGTKSFKIVFGPSGTDALSDEFFVSDVTPEYYEWSLKQDPTSGGTWVPGGTITWGVKLIS